MDFKSLKEILVNKKFSEDGNIAWGQAKKGAKISSAVSITEYPYIAFSKVSTKLVIIPFSETEVAFKKAIAIDKSKIKNVKVSGFGFYTNLKLWTIDGKLRKYSIIQGNKELKNIFSQLGF